MRALFGVVSLLLVLAVVGSLAARRLGAPNPAPAAAASRPTPAVDTPAEARALQDRVRNDVDRALRNAADARAGAEP